MAAARCSAAGAGVGQRCVAVVLVIVDPVLCRVASRQQGNCSGQGEAQEQPQAMVNACAAMY